MAVGFAKGENKPECSVCWYIYNILQYLRSSLADFFMVNNDSMSRSSGVYGTLLHHAILLIGEINWKSQKENERYIWESINCIVPSRRVPRFCPALKDQSETPLFSKSGIGIALGHSV